MAPLDRKGVIAAFVAPSWTDQARLRVWVKTIGAASAASQELQPLVLLTDDPSDGNNVLARQLRCSNVVCAIVRMPGTMKSTIELAKARLQRDLAMARLADVVFDFGVMSGGCRRFPDKETFVILEGQSSSSL
jgi:hypothetical protein